MKFLAFLFVCIQAFGIYPNFDDNIYLTDEMKKKISPHLLPLDHPIKTAVDQIFSGTRVTYSEGAIQAAGFDILFSMPSSHTIVAKHPLVPGYVFKIHLDSEKTGRYGTPSWVWLTRRCEYVGKIRKIIRKNNIRHFIVPDKWVYALPPSKKQPIVLIAQELDVLNEAESREAYQTVITPEHLHELHLILKTGLGSTHLDKNVPYTKQGKFAFIDTERTQKNYRKSVKYFSERMKRYWMSIAK
jgi:hypothetical protein